MAASIRRKNQRGTAMIETGLIIVPLIAMILGIGNICMLVFLKAVFQNAAREGVRWAITYSPTYQGSACPSQNACITQVVQDNSFGFLSGTAGAKLITINYYAPFSLSAPITSVPVLSTDPNFPNVNYLNQTNNVVEVVIAGFQWSWMGPITGMTPAAPMALGASASDVLEGYPVGTSAPPAP